MATLPKLIFGCTLVLSTVHAQTLPATQTPQVNCTTGVYDPACWEFLGMTDWLKDWYAQTPVCNVGPNVDTRKCRVADEAWTTTFLRIAQNVTSSNDCTGLGACMDDPPDSNSIRQDVNQTEQARYLYVCYNIYGETSVCTTHVTSLNRSSDQLFLHRLVYCHAGSSQ